MKTPMKQEPTKEMPLADYLKLCEELGIQRNEKGTVEFVAWPGTRVEKAKGGND